MAADDDNEKKVSLSTKWRNFRQSIWNSQKKEFIGRTGSSWAKIGLFYLIFYSCLAGFFAIMLTGFFATLSDEAPTQQGMYSLLKGNPGMGFRPMPNIESTLIMFKTGKPETYNKHIANIDKLLEPYNKTAAQKGDKVVDCSGDGTADLKSKEVCDFPLSLLGENCSQANDYGYYEGSPCVVLKINKIYGWSPQPFDNESLSDEHNTHAQDAKKAMGDRMSFDNIGISCDGENEGDADNIYKVTYYPDTGFSNKFFPYQNYPNYQQPLIFVKFNVRRGVLIQVWCKLWAKNIKHHKNDKAGSAHFELLVD